MNKQERRHPDHQGNLAARENELSGVELFNGIKAIFRTDYVTGLPCGELREFIRISGEDKDVTHLPATNERESIGIAAGAWLAGRQPALYMQNSGLFEASNDLGSLIIASRIPAVFVVSWRGAPGETATQHLVTGKGTKPLLESFGVAFTDVATEVNLRLLKEHQEATDLPVCVLQKREKFNEPEKCLPPDKPRRARAEVVREKGAVLNSREDVLAIIAEMTPGSTALISSTGLISRSLFHYFDSPNQFYNAGALGLTSSVGLGFSSVRPETPVTIVEGDGSVLTNLGNLNLIGHHRPNHFLHIVLDNESYASCSGESTVGSYLIPELASVFGYSRVVSVCSLEAIRTVIDATRLPNLVGPTMLHIKINNEGERRFKRPLEMSVIARRFQAHFYPNK